MSTVSPWINVSLIQTGCYSMSPICIGLDAADDIAGPTFTQPVR